MQSEVVQLPLGHRLYAWFETNRKQVIWGVGIVAGLVVIILFFNWNKTQQEINASEALSDISAGQVGNPGARPAPQAYLKVAANYPKSGAGARALLLAAGALYVEGKFPEAKSQFERFSREHHDSPFMGQALLGIAACWDAQGKTNEAVTAYKNLVDHHPGESVIPQAKFALARIYEDQGKAEQARVYYEELNRTEPYSSVGSEAGMRLEELLAKNPSLVPKPASTPMANPIPPTTSSIPLTVTNTASNTLPNTVPKP
jgi:tetratricopeptide (TPR) repeat protein